MSFTNQPRHFVKKVYFKSKTKNSLNLIYRPLLTFSRFNFLKFCEFWNLPVYPDCTNFNIHLIRNRLRLELLPYLKLFFNKNLLNTIKPIQNISTFENQYFQFLLQKIFLTFFIKKNFISKDKKFFQFITLKLKMNCFLNLYKTSKPWKSSLKKIDISVTPKGLANKTKSNYVMRSFLKKQNREKRIIFSLNKSIMKKPKFFYMKKFNKIRKYCQFLQVKKPIFMEIKDYFSLNYFDNYFYFLPISLKNCIFLYNPSSIKYNFLFFPKVLQYRILYNFYYRLRKRISFNEIYCLFEKLNIKKK